ncbi:SMC-Scp complex subunit ScpB [Parahaliea mediterranea]|uniref:SMC-Scp complex subunit ScpB n=1 Tax=Parahaliea mediterranea TaxID=651086 RepID=UPI000E2E6F4B|nr:SMC-Scp complex subunit ScpB [Parahaliea mediterranea]
MSEINLVQIIEGALLAAGRALSVAQIGELFEEHERPDNAAIREALASVAERCEERGFELQEVASGFRFQVRQELSPWVARLWQERPQKYSRALLETLALIAYRQPITRGEIEEIRGVAVSSNIIKTLHEREWIRVVGHRDVPGRPAMYATTRQFLDYFNLKNLDQLPALAEIRDLETLNAELGFAEPVAADAANEGGADAAAVHDEGAPVQPGLAIVGGTAFEGAQEPESESAPASAEVDGETVSEADEETNAETSASPGADASADPAPDEPLHRPTTPATDAGSELPSETDGDIRD